MPSTTAGASTNPTSYATLETLLLCTEVVQYGESGQSFNIISSALKENPLLTSSPNFDPGRLSGDTLRERWRDLVRDEGFGDDRRAGSAAGAARTAAVSRNGAASAPIGEKAVRDLTRRYWETYQNMMRDQIRTDEAEIAHLLDEIGNLENEQAREQEAKEAAEREAAAVAAVAKTTTEQTKVEAPSTAASKPVGSPVVAKTPLPGTTKAEEAPTEGSSSQHTTLRAAPPSPSKVSLKNILSDEPAQPERSVPLERTTSSESASRIGYDPIRDGSGPRAVPLTISETPQQRYPPIQPTEPIQGGYQIYEKPPQSIRRLSGSGPRPQPPPDFGHHIPSTSPGRPPVTPTGPRIGTFPQTGHRAGEIGSSPIYPRHDHEAYSNGHQSPLNTLGHAASRPPEDPRTPRQIHVPPSYSPTTSSYPPPQPSPSRGPYGQQLPPLHQISPRGAPVQPPFPPPPMQRLPSQEYIPHHSPGSEHQPLHSPMQYSHSNTVPPHSPFGHQATLPHPSQSPRAGSFSQPTMPPPQYSPTHTPQQFYQGTYPPPHSSPSAGYAHLQPPFQPQPSPTFAPPPSQMENRLPPINTPAQLPPLQYTTPKPLEPGRASSPLRPRPEEISPVLAPETEAGPVVEMELDEKPAKRQKTTKGKAPKIEPVEEPQEPVLRSSRANRQDSVDPHDEKTTKATRGRGTRGASRSRGTAASTRTRRGQSVSSVGRSTAEPEDMEVDREAAKEESVAPETIEEEPVKSKPPKKSAKSKKKAAKPEPEEEADHEEREEHHEPEQKQTRSGRTRKQVAEQDSETHSRKRQQPSESTEPETTATAETLDDHAHIETPRDADTPIEPVTPRPSFPLDMSGNATPTSSAQVKKFAQRAYPLLNNVSVHRFANLFMKPVDDKNAPSYSKIVYRPQDIKSIRAAIKAGAAQSAGTGTGTPTPTPTADGPSSSFGTTPSTPTAASVAAAKGAITNSAQLEKEIWRMFANAVMYNKSGSVVAEQAKEMARDVGAAIDNFRNAERIGERKAAEAAKEKERGVGGAITAGIRRRGSLIKSEIMGDDDSRKGDDEDEVEQEAEEEEEVAPKGNTKKERAAAKPKGANVRTRRGKKDKEGDVEMEDKQEEPEEEEADSDDDKTAEDDDEDGEEESSSSEEESEEEVEEEKEEKAVKPVKGKGAAASAAASRVKNTKTRAAAATAAATATAAKGRGTRKGSVQPAVEVDEEEGEKTGKGARGRGTGRTRATKGR
ncbi:hypothetical protein ABW19_dt0206528 [Dactylella cylindrospora]|nr:hypothetical protein ABW19_dt0206528 [Dactylella cylindrospora]